METAVISESIKTQAARAAGLMETPFYLFDVDLLQTRFARLRQAFVTRFPSLRIAYSYKTNAVAGITRQLRALGAGAEVVSGMEMQWALDDGFPAADVFFDGPVKPEDELAAAIRANVNVQVDSLDEVALLARLAGASGAPLRLGARLAAESEKGTVSRFGLLLDEYQVATRRLAEVGQRLSGIHLHVGSNLADPSRHVRFIAAYLPLIHDLLASGCERPWIDVGGGFPANTLGRNVAIASCEDFAEAIAGVFGNHGLPPTGIPLVIEPGRGLVEDCGFIVTRVVVRKRRPEQDLLVVDAGTNLLRSAGRWDHAVEFARPLNAARTRRFAVFGSLCYEDDQLGTNVRGDDSVSPGDLVVVSGAGGYNIPFAFGWTRPLGGIIGIVDGQLVPLRRRQHAAELRERDL